MRRAEWLNVVDRAFIKTTIVSEDGDTFLDLKKTSWTFPPGNLDFTALVGVEPKVVTRRVLARWLNTFSKRVSDHLARARLKQHTVDALGDCAKTSPLVTEPRMCLLAVVDRGFVDAEQMALLQSQSEQELRRLTKQLDEAKSQRVRSSQMIENAIVTQEDR